MSDATVRRSRRFALLLRLLASLFFLFGASETHAQANEETVRLGFSLSPRGKQALEVFKLARLELVPASDLLPVVLLSKEDEALVAEIAHKKGARR